VTTDPLTPALSPKGEGDTASLLPVGRRAGEGVYEPLSPGLSAFFTPSALCSVRMKRFADPRATGVRFLRVA
jgi:hypothetical protein